MCLLLETLKINNGFAENIFWHNYRFNAARRQLFNIDDSTKLENLIVVPDEFSNGLVKCRIGYGKEIEFVQFEHYIFREVRSLKIVKDPSIEYDYKYRNRTRINELFLLREGKDDILIVKNNLVCESSYSNVVFSDGADYFTPASPLLKGTKRAKYLAEGRITEREITVNDIYMFQEVHLINAFLDLGRCVILTSAIY